MSWEYLPFCEEIEKKYKKNLESYKREKENAQGLCKANHPGDFRLFQVIFVLSLTA